MYWETSYLIKNETMRRDDGPARGLQRQWAAIESLAKR